MKTKARKIERYVIRVHHVEDPRSSTEILVTKKQLAHINAVPVGEPFFLSRFYCMENSNRDQSGDTVRHADGTLWWKSYQGKALAPMPTTTAVQ